MFWYKGHNVKIAYMPTNLPPQYFEAEKRFRAAKEPEEKIAALQEMLGIMLRHKGTDKLHAAFEPPPHM